MEATHLQELQRLNESINQCVDACRRLVPQLTQAQQTIAQLGIPFQSPLLGVGYANPWLNVDPLAAAMIQQQLQAQRPIGYGMPWSFGPLGGLGVGSVGYGGWTNVGQPFAQPFPTTGFGIGAQMPFSQPVAGTYPRV